MADHIHLGEHCTAAIGNDRCRGGRAPFLNGADATALSATLKATPAHDSRRGQMKVLLAAALAIYFVGQTDKAFAYECNDNHYVNRDGDEVHSPSCGPQQDHESPTADCRDGSVSYSHHHSGTCSHHGGVAHGD